MSSIFQEPDKLRLTTKLRHIAAQENNDGEEYDLMVEAAKRIDELQNKSELLKEDIDAFHMAIDLHGVPRHEKEKELSMYGRALRIDATPMHETTKEPDYPWDDPDGSTWIVAIDYKGCVSIIQPPNIHDSFFDDGYSAESVGLPYDVDDTEAGVYQWKCSFDHKRCHETNVIDDWEFNPIETKLLWRMPS